MSLNLLLNKTKKV